MGGYALRKVVSAGAHSVEDVEFWRRAAERAEYISVGMRHWDAIELLQSFSQWKGAMSNHDWLLRASVALSETIREQMSSLAPKHVLDTLAACSALKIHPPALFAELPQAILRLMPAMYGDEIAWACVSVARFNFGDPSFLAAFSKAVISNAKQLRFTQACAAAGALKSLSDRFDASAAVTAIEAHARLELQMMSPMEIFDDVLKMQTLPYSWRPLEELLLKTGLQPFLDSSRGSTEIDQVPFPMDLFFFLKTRNMVNDNILLAYANWARESAARPKTRLGRRIQLMELAVIADQCAERGIGAAVVEEALKVFHLPTTPRPPAPLRYAKGRRYIRRADGYDSLVAISGSKFRRVAHMKRSPGALIRSKAPQAWTKFRRPWYYTK